MITSNNSSLNSGRSTLGGDNIKVMLVDDSAIIRGLIARMFKDEADIDVVASVGNGELAVKRLATTDIDVIVLDIEMPVMDGLTALPKLLALKPNVKIIMASTLTERNADISIRALNAGASEYIPKPTSSRNMGGTSDFQRELLEKTRVLAAVSRPRSRRPLVSAPPASGVTSAVAGAKKSLYKNEISLRPSPGVVGKPEIIAVGSSTGGPQALFKLLKGISPSIKLPIIITQHMPATFTTILAQHISQASGRPCSEAVDGEVIAPGKIYVAPGGFHMIVENKGGQKILRVNQDPPENFCRPAVDPMLRSVASVYGKRCLVVILTGMGSDGKKGCEFITQQGGTVIAQDEATSVVWGMPGAVATAGLCRTVLPIDKLPGYVNDFALKGVA